MNNDLTTLICLFHHKDHAHAALQDLLKAGIPEPNITLVGDQGSNIEASHATLRELNVPTQDLTHLIDGIKSGGSVLTVSAISTDVEKVEAIFKHHRADKIDEATVADTMSSAAVPFDSGVTEPVLVTEDFIAAETSSGVQVYRVLTVEPTAGVAAGASDVDPRELGLNDRLKPVDTQTY